MTPHVGQNRRVTLDDKTVLEGNVVLNDDGTFSVRATGQRGRARRYDTATIKTIVKPRAASEPVTSPTPVAKAPAKATTPVKAAPAKVAATPSPATSYSVKFAALGADGTPHPRMSGTATAEDLDGAIDLLDGAVERITGPVEKMRAIPPRVHSFAGEVFSMSGRKKVVHARVKFSRDKGSDIHYALRSEDGTIAEETVDNKAAVKAARPSGVISTPPAPKRARATTPTPTKKAEVTAPPVATGPGRVRRRKVSK
jgi:hypothetical protein